MAKKSVPLVRSVWNTYMADECHHTCKDDGMIGTNPLACGGVHLYQVRWTIKGWQRRILEVMGGVSSSGLISPISEEEGRTLFERAKAC
jgi:hypothetical protein